MDRILGALDAGTKVLDLGSRQGSFDPGRCAGRTFRLDIERLSPAPGTNPVQADAARLPFVDVAFDAVICNHSLEHFPRLDAVLGEIRRVLKARGVLFITVPDATTLTDRVYRFLAGGGGHVNRFRSAGEVISTVTRVTGLPLAGRRTLFTSLSFLHPANRGGERNRRFLVLLGAGERVLRLMNRLFRAADRRLGTRTAIYGWAFYFGVAPAPPVTRAWSNVCVRCGSGHPSEQLLAAGAVQTRGWFREYRCPRCGTRNFYTDDNDYTGAG